MISGCFLFAAGIYLGGPAGLCLSMAGILSFVGRLVTFLTYAVKAVR